MALTYVYGPSSSGKSSYLQNLLIQTSKSGLRGTKLLIVPDQYNMQTQMDMILRHPDRAFSDIEVLSFSRLSHRILEEVGGEDIPVLDDTGKSLIIRRVAGEIASELQVCGSKLDRIGYIHEIKSAISEFMQYGINPDGLHKIIEQSDKRKDLKHKLGDLERIYRAFLQYKSDKYLTREETLELVKDSLHKSDIVKGATIVFDGFTGFTPIQEQLIQELLVLADSVYISFTLDDCIDPFKPLPEENMFYLSVKSMDRLSRLAEEASVIVTDPIVIERSNAKTYRKHEIAHLEQNLFRYPSEKWEGNVTNIKLFQAKNIRTEVSDTCQRIRELTDVYGLRYRDIAVVVGDMNSYADEFVRMAEEYNIPIYMDYSRSVLQSPFIVAISAALDVYEHDYTCDSIIRYLRCGFSDISREDIDELENFLIRTGIRGRYAYEHTWTVSFRGKGQESETNRDKRLGLMDRLNATRQKLLDHFSIFYASNLRSVLDFSKALFEFMSSSRFEEVLQKRTDLFKQIGDISSAMEYEQIYVKVCDLLDQIVSLIGDEEISLHEYREILEAGFGEIKLGVIPQEADTVKVGDLIRTRLPQVKVLFLLGANDCFIPGNIGSGGLISDLDREFIRNETDSMLAPTPREQIFAQRLYLYMNMTKPSDKLVISYSSMDVDGKSMQQSYIVECINKLFPKIEILPSEITHTYKKTILPASPAQSHVFLAGLLREYVMQDSDADLLYDISIYENVISNLGDKRLVSEINKIAFANFQANPLTKEIADDLYGLVINTSISRLEKFAACAYAHFLSYGLDLRSRSEFGFEKRDLGDVFHLGLEQFARELEAKGLSWKDYTNNQSHQLVSEVLNEIYSTYGETVLLSSFRTKAMTSRIERILKRTVDTLQYQFAQGDFNPIAFEKRFFHSQNITISENRKVKMNITGSIDRVDMAHIGPKNLLRIVDYKSGNKQFDMNAFYNGIMLQLVVYMRRAMEAYPDSKPAGMLYYHIHDPLINQDTDISEVQLDSYMHSELTMKGIVSSDINKLGAMDHALGAGSGVVSDIIPVGFNKDGSLKASSQAISDDELEILLSFADVKIQELTKDILSGKKDPVPCGMDMEHMPCKYCDYRAVCNIDCGEDGYNKNVFEKKSKEDLLQLMKAQMREK